MLKVVLPSLDGVEDGLKGFYKEVPGRDGGSPSYVLQLEGVTTHPDVLALKRAHDGEKETVRTLKADLKTATTRLEGLPEDFDINAYETLKAAAEGKGAPDPAQIEQQIKDRVARAVAKAEKDRDEALTAAQGVTARLHARERDITLDHALQEAGVTDPINLKFARALLRDQLEVIADGDDLQIMGTDTELGVKVPATEFIKSWAATDEGKAMVGARQSGGSGGTGPGGGGGAKTMTRAQFEALDAGQRAAKIGEGFNVVD